MAGKLLHFLAIYHPLLMAHGIYLRVQLFVCFSMDLFFSHQKSDQKKKAICDRNALPSGYILTSLTSKWPAGKSSVKEAAVACETTFSFKSQRMQESLPAQQADTCCINSCWFAHMCELDVLLWRNDVLSVFPTQPLSLFFPLQIQHVL